VSVEMKLGRWRARNGNVHTVSCFIPDETHPWKSESGMAWLEDGSYFDDGEESRFDLIRYLGPLELSPTTACADQAGPPVGSTVSTETAGEQLQRMRARQVAIQCEAEIYQNMADALKQADSDLEERIRAIEKEHDL